jgi:hypothetical protein
MTGRRQVGVIEFTENYEDLSTDTGYQFKFFCNHCGNGYMSSYQIAPTKAAGGLLRAAGGLFGGALEKIGASEADVERLAAGPGHDRALTKAVSEIRPKFNQCTRCGRWVCQPVCWNGDVGLCTVCAPKREAEVAHAKSDAEIAQLYNKAMATDLVGDVDFKQDQIVRCPQCNAESKGGKFCASCGTPLAPKRHCTSCGQQMDYFARFCPNCGNPQD